MAPSRLEPSPLPRFSERNFSPPRIDELARARSVEELEHAQVDRDVRAERRRRLAESPLAFPAHGRSVRPYRQALYEFEKERWRRGEADSHPFDRDIYPPENGEY